MKHLKFGKKEFFTFSKEELEKVEAMICMNNNTVDRFMAMLDSSDHDEKDTAIIHQMVRRSNKDSLEAFRSLYKES